MRGLTYLPIYLPTYLPTYLGGAGWLVVSCRRSNSRLMALGLGKKVVDLMIPSYTGGRVINHPSFQDAITASPRYKSWGWGGRSESGTRGVVSLMDGRRQNLSIKLGTLRMASALRVRVRLRRYWGL